MGNILSISQHFVVNMKSVSCCGQLSLSFLELESCHKHSNMLRIVYRILYADFLFPAPPEAPTHLQVTTVSTNSISIMWMLGNDGGSSITGVTVEYQSLTPQVSDSGVHILGEDSTLFTIPRLQPNAAYEIRVYAQNDIGSGRPATLNASTLRLRELWCTCTYALDIMYLRFINFCFLLHLYMHIL